MAPASTKVFGLPASLLAGALGGCTPGLPSAALHTVDLSVGEQQRKMLVYVPTRPAGLGMVSFHGFHSNPWADVVELMNQTAYAEKYGVSLAIPFGTSWTWPSPFCCRKRYNASTCAKHRPMEDTFDVIRACGWNFGPVTALIPAIRKMDDVALAKAAGSFLVENACVEDSRVFVLGFSMGSMMANHIACKAADSFAGIVAISGSRGILVGCKPARPLSYMGFCGTADPVCYITANRTAQLWAEVNGCEGEPQPTYTTETTRCSAYSGCRSGGWVEQCFLIGMDDQVPGHNRTADFGKMPYQPVTNVDAIDYSFKRYSFLGQIVLV